MHDTETTIEKAERFYRLLDRVISQIALGQDSQTLRRQLEVAIMISPLSGADQSAALARFDAAVELVDQFNKSLKAHVQV